MIRSKAYCGSRYNILIFLLSDALVICCEQIVKTERISSDVLQMSVYGRTAFERRKENRKNEKGEGGSEKEARPRSLCTLTTIGTGRGDRSNANRSFENRSAATGGSNLGDGCSRRDRLLLPVRRIGVPCYRVMSLLFKNHATELHVLQSITIM